MIRKMLPSDYNFIYKLGAQLNINYAKLNKLDDIVNDNNQKVYVYIINNNVVGFLHITISFDEADIVDIITSEEYRNHGIGNSLISYAIKDNNLKKINLEVRESNKIAIEFYQKINFKKVRIIKKYYGTEDAFFMVKEI
mgnify:FL=1